MSGQAAVRRYALRRVNPFLGVEQILETPQARAKSTNGIVWQVELPAVVPSEWGSLSQEEDREQEWRWSLRALWSDREGLVSFPRTAMSLERSEQLVCQALIETIKSNAGSLPFALSDHSELWLLDRTQKRPLALLLSKPPGAVPPRGRLRHWHGRRGSAETPGQRQLPDIQRLEAAVRKRAGFNASTLWVTWDPSRTRAATQDGRTIDSAEFPVFGIREDWADEQERALVARYIEWIAPSLLTLPYLRDEQRARLESSLLAQAPSIEYHWRLYPKVLDEGKIAAARVASRMQSSEYR